MSDESFRDTLYTINKDGRRKWLYPHLVKGRFFKKRAVVAYFLVAFYLLLPWITINGQQAVFINIVERQFTFFGLTLWATDTIFLTLTLLAAVLSLFFFTSILGRVWCGWACPETVFLEFVFRPIERWIEGGPVQRQKLDESPWNLEKFKKKFLMHSIRAVIAWVLASTALAYFIGRGPLLEMMTGSPLNNLPLFLLTIALMGLMAFQFGWFREQFCTILCPYARFQSVMLDRNSLVVGYDVKRGEPRGKQRTGEEEKGDCIDCGLCVRVCPTGIDIRNGLQLECINCTACMDACDSIMSKLSRPLGLIRYDSEAVLLDGEQRKFSIRPVVYGIILTIIISIFVYVLANRSSTDFQVVRGAMDDPFTVTNKSLITNHLHIKISNKSQTEREYTISVRQADINALVPNQKIVLQSGEMKTIPLFLSFPIDSLIAGKREAEVILISDGEEIKTQSFTLLGPDKNE